MILALRGARRRIWIESPYFASDEIAAAVASAAQRGVDVRLILPSTSNLATAYFLIHAGVKVFRYPKMAHTKLANRQRDGRNNLDCLAHNVGDSRKKAHD